MKGSPMQRNFGIDPTTSDESTSDESAYYEVSDPGNTATKSGQGTDVTAEYAKKGSSETRDHIASGGKVYRMPDGSLSLTKSTN